MKKKRVLIFVNHELSIYNFRKELVEKLLSLKHEVFISVPKGDKVNKLVSMGVNLIDTEVDRRGTNFIKDYMLYKRYKRIIKEVKPNVIFTYTIKPNIYGGFVAAKYNIPYIANMYGQFTLWFWGFYWL